MRTGKLCTVVASTLLLLPTTLSLITRPPSVPSLTTTPLSSSAPLSVSPSSENEFYDSVDNSVDELVTENVDDAFGANFIHCLPARWGSDLNELSCRLAWQSIPLAQDDVLFRQRSAQIPGSIPLPRRFLSRKYFLHARYSNL